MTKKEKKVEKTVRELLRLQVTLDDGEVTIKRIDRSEYNKENDTFTLLSFFDEVIAPGSGSVGEIICDKKSSASLSVVGKYVVCYINEAKLYAQASQICLEL
jgi:hypothetical protein